MRPVKLINVKVLDVQVKLLFAQLTGCDGFQGGACRATKDISRKNGAKENEEQMKMSK